MAVSMEPCPVNMMTSAVGVGGWVAFTGPPPHHLGSRDVSFPPPSPAGMRYRHRPEGGRVASLSVSVLRLRTGIDGRDHDFEYRPLSKGTLDQDVASPTPDGVQRQEQTEASAALAEAEKRPKDLLTVFRGNAASFIGDANVHRIAACGGHDDLAARLRCLNRVEQKIDQQVDRKRVV